LKQLEHENTKLKKLVTDLSVGKYSWRSSAESSRSLTVRERLPLFCAASNTDWEHAGIPGETVTAVVVKGLITRDAGGRLDLTEHGLAALRSMLPEL
jgi:hypothetical protein